MILSEDARALRKQQQTERLAAKKKATESGDWESYSKFFAGQGRQVAKAEHNAKITQARKLVRSTKDAIDVAKVSGVNITGALSDHSTAKVTLGALDAQKQLLFGNSKGFGLSGGGA